MNNGRHLVINSGACYIFQLNPFATNGDKHIFFKTIGLPVEGGVVHGERIKNVRTVAVWVTPATLSALAGSLNG
jgi:hypothetical protein